MSLDSLPDELIGIICSFCDTPEIKTLRLTCRALRKVANEHLLTEIVLFMNRDSLGTCKSIAAHPVISKTARKIWIQADRPKEATFDDWNKDRKHRTLMQYVREAADFVYPSDGAHPGRTKEQEVAQMDAKVKEIEAREEPKKPVLSEKQLEHHYTEACRLMREAEAILHNGCLFSRLKKLLARCPRIEAIDLTQANHIRICSSKNNKAFQKGFLHPFGDLDRYNCCVDIMGELVLAASAAGFQPRLLRLGGVSHNIFMREDFLDELQQFFSSLEELEWQFSVPYLDEDCRVDEDAMDDLLMEFDATNSFTDLMEAAVGLKRLRLDLPNEGDDDAAAVSLQNIVGDITWEHLTHFHLSSFATTAEELSDFLLCHAGTLLKVTIGDAHIHRGKWPDCFVSFAGKLPNLQAFELRGKFEEEETERIWYTFGLIYAEKNNKYGREVAKYLIGGGEKCPPRPKRLHPARQPWSFISDSDVDSSDENGGSEDESEWDEV
jgi:hypothetical protein